MRQALDVFWESLRDWYNGMVGLAVLNFLWFVLSLTVILLPPATAGIMVVMNSLAHGTGAHLSDFGPAVRRYAWVSYRWALLNAAAVVIFLVGFRFYGAIGTIGVFIQVFFVTAGLLWIATQFYTWPFLLEQEDKRLRLALKNGLFLTLANPIYTLILLGMVAVAVVLSAVTILPIAVFATSFIALLANRAVRERLITYGKLPTV